MAALTTPKNIENSLLSLYWFLRCFFNLTPKQGSQNSLGMQTSAVKWRTRIDALLTECREKARAPSEGCSAKVTKSKAQAKYNQMVTSLNLKKRRVY